MISQNIQAARKALGLTQEDLANRLSVARQTVAKWESGESLPDLENAYALAKLLGVSVDDLIAHNEAATGYPIPPPREAHLRHRAHGRTRTDRHPEESARYLRAARRIRTARFGRRSTRHRTAEGRRCGIDA